MTRRKMTREEAAEHILRGEPFLPCTKCGGLGYERKASPTPESLKWAGRIDVCLDCTLSGMVIDGSYARACRMLGVPLPERPKPFSGPKMYKSIRELAQEANQAVFVKYAEEDAVCTQRLMAELRDHPELPKEP